MLGLAIHLDLNAGSTSFSEALQLPLSYAKAYLGHDYYTQHTKNEDARQRLVIAGIDRINSVIKAIHGLGKALTRR